MNRGTCLLLLPLLFPANSIADWTPDAIRAGYGQYINLAIQRTADIKQYRLGVVWNISDDLWSSESVRLKSYAELGFGYWKSELNPPYNSLHEGSKVVNQVSLVPMFRFISQNPMAGTVHPFLDIGVGPSYQDQEDIEQGHPSGINTGGKFQFEIRLLAGIEFGSQQQFELSYGWMHYSNANINDINEGLDFQTVQFGYHF